LTPYKLHSLTHPEPSRGASESLGKLRVIRTLEMIREAAVQRWPTGSWTSGITLVFGLSFLTETYRRRLDAETIIALLSTRGGNVPRTRTARSTP
jgi:hypothetical protein